MKKRLLSAALALAMVLTLLPVSAFAAVEYKTPEKLLPNGATATYTEKNGTEKKYYDNSGSSITTVVVEQATEINYTDGRIAGNWYWLKNKGIDADNPQYCQVDSGIIAGVNGKGNWYPDVAAYAKDDKVTGAFTVLGTTAVDLSTYTNTSLTIDVANEVEITVPSTLTSLTLTSKYAPAGKQGTITAITTDRADFENDEAKNGLTVTATGLKIGAITMAGRPNTLKLTKCTVTDAVSMDGAYKNSASATADTYAAQTITASGCTFNNTITITKSNSASVTLTDTTVKSTVSVTSDGGSVKVDGYSSTGKITVSSRTQSGNAAIPSVTVNGGTVAGIERTDKGSTASSSFTIQQTNNSVTISAPIVTSKGTVTVNAAKTGNITVESGALTVSGASNDIGEVKLGDTGATDLTISATNSKFSKITGNSNLTIKAWPTGRGNYYGTLALDSYAGNGVKGGTFAKDDFLPEAGKVANLEWFDKANLQFIVPVKGDATKVALYGKTELTQAISDIAATTAADKDNPIVVLGQGEKTTDQSTLQLNFGGQTWAYIQYNATTGILLPTQINNTTITKWIVNNGKDVSGITNGTEFNTNKVEAIPALGDTLILTSTNVNTSAVVTKITNATNATSTTVENKDVRVRLNGNNIELSGAITVGAGGYADVTVNLITDVIDSNGEPIVMDVIINYNVETKKASFSGVGTSLSAYGAIVQDDKLVLNRGTGASYTVSANLTVSASTLKLYAPAGGNDIVATLSGSTARFTDLAKKALTEQLEAGKFEFMGTGAGSKGDNKAMLEAINAAQATITNNSSVTTWIANAKNYVWKNGYTKPDGSKPDAWSGDKHAGNYVDFASVTAAKTDYEGIRDAFSTAYIVPYLVVNVTEYNQNGTMTATLTPYYRVDVSGETYDPEIFYTVQAGRALSALTGDMSNPIKVSFAFDAGSVAATNFATAFMHQDGKYVYQGATQTWSIYHAGTTGLGSIVINSTDGPISFPAKADNAIDPRVPALPVYKYDTLQAAIDDTVPGVTQPNTTDNTQVDETYDTIQVDGSYKGSCDITMTGSARKVKVVGQGNLPIKTTSKDVDVQNPSGWTYYIQLKRDTVVEENSDTTVAVASATGGTARVSNTKAKAGEKVTITLTPATGYTAGSVTVRTAEGTNVTVSGSGNSYTFTMPSSTKKVTVTPAFKKTDTGATVSVANTSYGTATTSAGTNKVAAGSTVTVATSPSSGYRTMGLYVTSNSGNSTATRTGANSFTFTVPSNATNVVVTPRFDVNNGTLFEDVWSTEYYSAPVAWAVGRGITNGTSTYTFGSNNSCTRADMVTFLYRAAGSPAVSNVANPFWDVQPGAYYYNAVLWAVSKGITNGVSANQFGVNQYVSRAQAVTFLYRYNGSPAASTYSGYYDVPASEYYAKAVAWANATGVTNGTSTTLFSPNTAVSRAQAVTFLYRNATGVRA